MRQQQQNNSSRDCQDFPTTTATTKKSSYKRIRTFFVFIICITLCMKQLFSTTTGLSVLQFVVRQEQQYLFLASPSTSTSSSSPPSSQPYYNYEKKKKTTFASDDDLSLLLSSVSKLRFYIYDYRTVLTRDIINKVTIRGGSQRDPLGIFQILFHNNHSLRTYDPYHADFIIAPILFYGISRKPFRQSMDNLMSTSIFNRTYYSYSGSRKIPHLYFSFDGRAFDSTAPGPIPRDIKITYRNVFEDNAIVIKNYDMMECQRMHQQQNQHHGDWKELFGTIRPIPKAVVSLGLTPGMKDLPLSIPTNTIDGFYNTKNWTFFYHTRTGPSARDSTKYRHAPLKLVNDTINNKNNKNNKNHDDDDKHLFIRQSSIGTDIPKHVWLDRFSKSKFCLIIRGDTPDSHAFFRSIRVGCIPVIVSDYYPRYAPPFKSILNMTDFSILIDEEAFLKNPGLELRKIAIAAAPRGSSSSSSLSLNNRTTTTATKMLSRTTRNNDDGINSNNTNNNNNNMMKEGEWNDFIYKKIEALKFAQRVLFVDHPESLFVPALLKEAALTYYPPPEKP